MNFYLKLRKIYFQSLICGLVKIPNIPFKIKNKVRLIQKKEGQNRFYKNLLKLDNKVKGKFDSNDTQRSIRAFEIKSYTKVSMYDWLSKTKSNFKDNEFLKLYINFDRDSLIKRITKRTSKMIKIGAIQEVKKFNKLKLKKERYQHQARGYQHLEFFYQLDLFQDV